MLVCVQPLGDHHRLPVFRGTQCHAPSRLRTCPPTNGLSQNLELMPWTTKKVMVCFLHVSRLVQARDIL